MNFLISFEYDRLQNFQSLLHFQHSQPKLSNEFLLIHTLRDLLHIPHPLFYVTNFLNKRHET